MQASHEVCTQAPRVAPLSYAATARDLSERLGHWAQQLGETLDLSTLVTRWGDLVTLLDRFEAAWWDRPTAQAWRAQTALARHLVPLGYVAGSVFEHDPALAQPAMPRLAAIAALLACDDEVAVKHHRVAVQRRVNHVAWELREACRVARTALDAMEVA